jgi:hypothetical protein
MNVKLPLSEPQERHVATILAHLEKAVRDLKNEGLRGYGEVAPATARYFEKEIPKLEALVNEIVGLLGRVK